LQRDRAAGCVMVLAKSGTWNWELPLWGLRDNVRWSP